MTKTLAGSGKVLRQALRGLGEAIRKDLIWDKAGRSDKEIYKSREEGKIMDALYSLGYSCERPYLKPMARILNGLRFWTFEATKRGLRKLRRIK